MRNSPGFVVERFDILDQRKGKTEEIMRINCQLVAISILSLMPLASMTQEVVPDANREVKVD